MRSLNYEVTISSLHIHRVFSRVFNYDPPIRWKHEYHTRTHTHKSNFHAMDGLVDPLASELAQPFIILEETYLDSYDCYHLLPCEDNEQVIGLIQSLGMSPRKDLYQNEK